MAFRHVSRETPNEGTYLVDFPLRLQYCYVLLIYTGCLGISTVETEITWKNKIGIQIFARSIILSKKMILKIGDLITLALF